MAEQGTSGSLIKNMKTVGGVEIPLYKGSGPLLRWRPVVSFDFKFAEIVQSLVSGIYLPGTHTKYYKS